MEYYKNLNRDSGVSAYEFDVDSITVRFKDGALYKYTHTSAGINHIEKMKMLAQVGRGLNAYINTHVKKRYEAKLR